MKVLRPSLQRTGASDPGCWEKLLRRRRRQKFFLHEAGSFFLALNLCVSSDIYILIPFSFFFGFCFFCWIPLTTADYFDSYSPERS